MNIGRSALADPESWRHTLYLHQEYFTGIKCDGASYGDPAPSSFCYKWHKI